MNPASGPPTVAVIGGGWAGCAAAVTLAQAGVQVALFEQARVLGGRARRVGVDGLPLDNGQHLLIGACRQTLALIETVHGRERAQALFQRLPLALRPFGTRATNAPSFRAWRAPAPLHLVGGFITARGLPWRDRWSLISAFRAVQRARFQCPPEQSVAECFAATPDSVMRAFWSPLCIAALNTSPDHASAQFFANVLRAAFTGRSVNSHLLVPMTDLSSIFPDAAMRYVEARGGSTHIGCTVRSVVLQEDNVLIDTNAGHERVGAAIVAVGPHQLAALVDGQGGAVNPWRSVLKDVAAFRYEPITTVYLAYTAPVPMASPIARLDDAPGQWLFNRSAALRALPASPARALLAVVLSGNGAHDELDQQTLASAINAQLKRLAPAMPALLWSRVISDRRATYACTPALQRPVAARIAGGIYLAGDYTHPDLPATLEAATRSGVAAANALLADMRATAL